MVSEVRIEAIADIVRYEISRATAYWLMFFEKYYAHSLTIFHSLRQMFIQI